MIHRVVAKDSLFKAMFFFSCPTRLSLLHIIRLSLFPLIGAPGVREERDTVCSRVAFSNRARVQVEGLKVKSERRGGSSGAGHTIL